ncbi:MAG: hypothetical protein JXQ99_20285 [Hyphomicrobiaceae bacterium]
MLNISGWLRGRSKISKTAAELYGSIVAQARQPAFYTHYRVPDVAEKRYEMIVLHMVMVLERLRAAGDNGGQVAQGLVETFVGDLDGSIREMAIGDPKVPTHVKKAAAGLLDRDVLYRQTFIAGRDGSTDDTSNGDDMTLRALLSELLFDDNDATNAEAMERYVLASRASLQAWSLEDADAGLTFARPDDFRTG